MMRRQPFIILVDTGLVLLLALALARFVLSAVLRGRFDVKGEPAWFGEQLPPLFGLVAGEPISEVDPRQYGVVALLVIDPVLRAFGRGFALDLYSLAVVLVAAVGAYLLLMKRYFANRLRAKLGFAVLWFSFVPLLVGVASRLVDVWQLSFIALSLVLFTATGRVRLLSGVPLAVGTLTKLLPAAVLVFLAITEWRAGVVAGLALLALFGVGQALYGPLMGFEYPLVILSRSGDTVGRFAPHWENNSLRGFLFKLAARFRVEPRDDGSVSGYMTIPSSWGPPLNFLVTIIAMGLFVYLLTVAWRSRRDDSLEGRSLVFGFAVLTMLLISPHTAHEYMVMAMPPLAVLLWLWLRGVMTDRRLWYVVGFAGFLLIGVFIPVSIAGALLQLDHLVRVSSNSALGIPATIGAYDLFGFPAIGLILVWLAFAVLEHQWRGTQRQPP